MSWAQRVPDVALELACSGETHRLRWSAGRISAAAHPDIAGEEALAAFGGDLPACVDALLRWRDAVADGGFMTEWCDMNLDDPVYRHQLRVAVHRLRVEGVQDLFRALPPRRAAAMGGFLLRFPQLWVDRAALAVVRAGRALPPGDPRRLPVQRAVQVRTRSAFVRSLRRWSAVVRPAALVRFECAVVPWGSTPHVEGILNGTASWCRLSVSPQWLLDVWGPGEAVNATGDLVLAPDGSALQWTPSREGPLRAELTPP